LWRAVVVAGAAAGVRDPVDDADGITADAGEHGERACQRDRLRGGAGEAIERGRRVPGGAVGTHVIDVRADRERGEVGVAHLWRWGCDAGLQLGLPLGDLGAERGDLRADPRLQRGNPSPRPSWSCCMRACRVCSSVAIGWHTAGMGTSSSSVRRHGTSPAVSGNMCGKSCRAHVCVGG